MLPGGAPVKANVTTRVGVVFIPHPPDLRVEPTREEWHQGQKAHELGEAALSRIVKNRLHDMSPEAAIEWKCFHSLHARTKCSEHLPNLPADIEITGDSSTYPYLAPGEKAKSTFDGTPRLLLPVLREMVRFPRPLITWNIFEEAPPTTFPTTPTAGDSDEDSATTCKPMAEEAPLREPREANNVTHSLNTDGQRRKGLQADSA